MLTQSDIKFMNETVSSIVTSWNSTVAVLTPLPIDKQNYNPILKEVIGKMKYTKSDIPAERKYIVNNYDHNIDPSRNGDKDGGEITYSVPLYVDGKIFTPTLDHIFYIDGAVYRVRSMRERIGENIVILYKYTGITIDNIDIVEV